MGEGRGEDRYGSWNRKVRLEKDRKKCREKNRKKKKERKRGGTEEISG